jgi:alcohol dehydrogenase
MAAHDYPSMLAEIASGTLSPQRLVQHRIGLREAPAKLAALDHQPDNGITIISPHR